MWHFDLLVCSDFGEAGWAAGWRTPSQITRPIWNSCWLRTEHKVRIYEKQTSSEVRLYTALQQSALGLLCPTHLGTMKIRSCGHTYSQQPTSEGHACIPSVGQPSTAVNIPWHSTFTPFCFIMALFTWESFWIMFTSSTSCIWRASGGNFRHEIHHVEKLLPPLTRSLLQAVAPCPKLLSLSPQSALMLDSRKDKIADDGPRGQTFGFMLLIFMGLRWGSDLWHLPWHSINVVKTEGLPHAGH